MSKIQENKKLKKERLLDAAYELFTTKGVDETSVSDITKKALVAKGTFYLYFKDKYEIEKILISRKSNIIIATGITATIKKHLPTKEENLFYFINYVIDCLNTDTTLLTFIQKNLSWGVFTEAISGEQTDSIFDIKKLINIFVYDIDVTGCTIEDVNNIDDIVFDKTRINYKDVDIMIYTIIEVISSTLYSVILSKKPTDLETYKPYLFGLINAILKQHEI